MSNRREAWPRGRWLIGAAAVALALVIVWALLVPGADWLARHDVGSAKGSLATARDAARGRLLTLGAGLFAAGALLFTAQNFILSRRTLELSQRTFELTEQGQVTDRFTKAIEQLGSKELDIRIGGIYGLERIARDSAKDHPTVMEVLTTFIREHSQDPWPVNPGGDQDGEKKTRPDVQAAVTVVGRRDPEHDILSINLTGADLAGANLTYARLSSAILTGVIFTRANLRGARLIGANLAGAILTDAKLIDTDLGSATLTDAHLDGADLYNADLGDAHLTGANLTGANLINADLTSADLTSADLTRASLVSADLSDTRLAGANLSSAVLEGANLTDLRKWQDPAGATLTALTGADLTGARWAATEPFPEGWTVDSGRLKRAGQLSEVTDHYL